MGEEGKIRGKEAREKGGIGERKGREREAVEEEKRKEEMEKGKERWGRDALYEDRKSNIVDVIHKCLFDDVLSERLSVTETLEGRVYVACVTNYGGGVR